MKMHVSYESLWCTVDKIAVVISGKLFGCFASLNPVVGRHLLQHRGPDVKATPGKDAVCVHEVEIRKYRVRVPPVTSPYVHSTASSSLLVTNARVNKLLSNMAVNSNNSITWTAFNVFIDFDSCYTV